MLSFTNVVAPRNPTSNYITQPPILAGGSADEYAFLFCATARNNDASNAALKGTKFLQATRTSSSCYMVGLKENIEIQCADGLPWQWRRICFTYKGQSNLPPGTTSFATAILASAGQTRVVNEIPISSRNAFYGLLFKGNVNADWTDVFTAPVDTSRVSLKYDKTITIASGNEEGVIRKYKRWHPMGHNLLYDDDELGGNEAASNFSVSSRIGMGDYYVLDIIKPRVGSTSASQLLFQPTSTLYWHEK